MWIKVSNSIAPRILKFGILPTLKGAMKLRLAWVLLIYLASYGQGSHKLWKSCKTRKITKKSSMDGKIMEFEKIMNNHGKIMEFCGII